MTYTDFLGTPIEIGSRVVYATQSGNSAAMRTGIVSKITPGSRNMGWTLKQLQKKINESSGDERFFAEYRLEAAKKMDYKITLVDVADADVPNHPDEPKVENRYFKPRDTVSLGFSDRWAVVNAP